VELRQQRIELEVAIWTTDPWDARHFRGDINRRIWRAFKDADVVIAFPQLDVHVDELVMKSLAHLERVRPAA
jgi:small-conductance mechanosensitive channel